MNDLEKGIKILKEYNHINSFIPLKGFDTFRALMNITMPDNLDDDFYELEQKIIKDEYLKRNIIDVDSLKPIKNNLYLYLGDITLIKADAIVNACNSELLGCFHPLHNCIDNCIHSYAGLEVRRDLTKIMIKQNGFEANGRAKITKGYNLPSKYILHTVGPIVNGYVSEENKADLYNCYQSCLRLADEYKLESIVFCAISTGLYGYPIKPASNVAITSVNDYLKNNSNTSIKKVVFNLFKESDYDVYKRTIEENN